MSIVIGNTNYGLSLGSTKIFEAYIGSQKIYSAVNYDHYLIRLEWSGGHNITMAGVSVDDTDLTTSDVISARFRNGSWSDISSSDLAAGLPYSNSTSGPSFYGTRIEITFNWPTVPIKARWHSAQYYGGDSMTVNISLIGITSNNEEIVLATGSRSNSAGASIIAE